MAHVFISYSSSHVALTKQLAAFLESCGLDVWWDRALEARGPFAPQIHENLRTAGAVVVLWTRGALTSDWVKQEAQHALSKDMLINIVAEDVAQSELPSPFDTHERHRPFDTDLILRDVLAVREGRLLLEDKRESLPPPDARTPTMLLQAKFGLIPYLGADSAKANMIAWALGRNGYAAQARRAAGRLLHAPGGVGKTRLLIEVAEELRRFGWSAGFLTRADATYEPIRRQRRMKALSHLVRGATDKGLLLVLDYAEDRAEEVELLSAEIQARPNDERRPIRLVLLSRSAGDWWTRLHSEALPVQTLFARPGGSADVVELPGLATGQQRVQLFLNSIMTLASPFAEQGYPTPVEPPGQSRLQRIEKGASYERPLAITIEALLYLAGAASTIDEPFVHNLLVSILGLERAHWKKLLGPLSANDRRDPELDIRRAVAQVTSVQGVGSRADAEALFMADRYYARAATSVPERSWWSRKVPSPPPGRNTRDSVREVTDNITKVYARGTAVMQLEPDLIGEHHIALFADLDLVEGCLAWIATLPEVQQATRRHDLLTVLQRATQPEHGTHASTAAAKLLEHIACNHMQSLAREIVAVLTNTPGQLERVLAEALPRLDVEHLRVLTNALPMLHLRLLQFALKVTDRFTVVTGLALRELEARGHPIDTPALAYARHRHAAALSQLSLRLTQVGRREEALKASQAMVVINRQLADAIESPAAYFDLASSLNTLGAALSELGRRDEALAALQEAIQVLRILAAEEPGGFAPYLAGSLTNFAGVLHELGRSNEALIPALEATELYRQVDSQDEAKQDTLAKSLHMLAIALSARAQERRAPAAAALSAINEAVHIRKRLTIMQPEAFLPDLASTLDVAAALHGKAGRHHHALGQAGEAVQIFLGLAKDHGDAFSEPLGNSLTNLARLLEQLGRLDEAVVPAQRALEVWQPLAARWPEKFVPNMARALIALSRMLKGLGRNDEAAVMDQSYESLRPHLQMRKNLAQGGDFELRYVP